MTVQASTQAHPTSPYDDVVCSYSWSCQKALDIMWCESSNRPGVYNKGNYGLMQINGVHAAEFAEGDATRFYDPYLNIEVAYQLYLRRGWQPWSGCL